MATYKEIVHLFSGGIDSTYSAALLTGMFDKIHLVTYQRFGFTNTENSNINAEALMKRYGKDRFTHTFINYDKEFNTLSFKHQYSDFFKHGFYVLINCGMCKLAMDWRTLIYCVDNGIKYVSIGSGKEMAFDASQKIEIVKEVRAMYASFGIQYFTPGFDTEPEAREVALLQLGIIKRLGIKWSPDTWNFQPDCKQEYMNLFLIEYVCGKHNRFINTIVDKNFLKYHGKMSEIHRAKREEVKKYVREYIESKNRSKTGA